MIHYYNPDLFTVVNRAGGQIIERCYHKQGLWHIEVRGAPINETLRLRGKARGRSVQVPSLRIILGDKQSKSPNIIRSDGT